MHRFERPGLVEIGPGQGGLAKLTVTTHSSRTEIYLHGAQVTGYQKEGEPPLLFLSQLSRFVPGKAIRGGIPICFPWFGSRPGEVAHGVARIVDWDLADVSVGPAREVTVRMRLPREALPNPWASLNAECIVQVGEALSVELAVSNDAHDGSVEYESCLHSYFAVSNIGEVAVAGLKDTEYVDHTRDEERFVQDTELTQVSAQMDRTYLNSTRPVEIHDSGYGRTVPGGEKRLGVHGAVEPVNTQLLNDLERDEYRRMICVESGNVGPDRLLLPANMTHRLRITLRSGE